MAARVQGQRRFAAIALSPGKIALIEFLEDERIIAESPFDWTAGATYSVGIEVAGQKINAIVEPAEKPGPRKNPTLLTGVLSPALDGGAIGILCEAGRLEVGPVSVGPCP